MSAAPIQKLAEVELPAFPDDQQQAIYDLLATAESGRTATAQLGNVHVTVEAAA